MVISSACDISTGIHVRHQQIHVLVADWRRGTRSSQPVPYRTSRAPDKSICIVRKCGSFNCIAAPPRLLVTSVVIQHRKPKEVKLSFELWGVAWLHSFQYMRWLEEYKRPRDFTEQAWPPECFRTNEVDVCLYVPTLASSHLSIGLETLMMSSSGDDGKQQFAIASMERRHDHTVCRCRTETKGLQYRDISERE
jgi:hypothetical protein